MMVSRILVPLDGSPYSERAVSVAEEIAVSCDAEVALLRIVEIVAPGGEEPGVISYLDEHRVREATDYVTGMRGAIRRGRRVSATASIAGDAATGIREEAADTGVDLIVMTSHARSWPMTGALGSVAARLLQEAQCPVLIVGPGAVFPRAPIPETLGTRRGNE